MDEDFLALTGPEHPGILYVTDETLTARRIGDIVHEISCHIAQADVELIYVTVGWIEQ